MKRTLVWILLLLALLLAGCGREASPDPASTQTPQPVPGVTLEPVPVETGSLPAPSADADAGEIATLSFDEAAARVRADADAVYLFAANVGKGDALVLRCGDWAGLIDTGRTPARGVVVRALSLMGAGAPDAVFLTHTDDDHIGGLRWMAETDGGLALGAVCASAMYAGVKPDKHPAVRVAGDAVQWLERGDEIALGDSGATLKVLAPASFYEDEDDNSLVMMLESPHGKILLTGDMELPEEAELLSQGDDLSCAVLKVANHGDDDTTSAEFANACAARIAVVSTDSLEKPGTPDPGVVSRLEAAGSRVIVTENSGLGILITLKGGVPQAQYVDFGAEPLTGVSIADVDASDDRITLQNTSAAAVSLDGCYLYSDRGSELFAFPDASIEPGASLTVGTNSTDGDFDLLWDDKKVVHRKKEDTICLYDSWGRIVDAMENGM